MRIALVASLLLGSTIVVANAQSQQPVFEVASITPVKQLPPGDTGFGGVTQDPSMVSIKSVNLKSLLRRAYGLRPFQISGPDWLDTQYYDVTAKLPAGAKQDEIPAMLQRLVNERFQLELRWETKQETGYALVIDKGGPKLTQSADQTTQPGDQPDRARSVTMSDTVKMQGATTAALADALSSWLGVPVVDSTGVPGRYDVTLRITVQDLAAALQGPPASPSVSGDYTPGVIFDAVRDLGLRLQPQKMDVKHLTVVKADRIPTEN